MMMHFAKRFPFTGRSLLVRLLASVMCASGLVAAQAPVAPASISADVLLALLGSGTAIEIGLPDDVRVVHVVATRGDEVIAQRSDIRTDAGDGAASIVVSVGAVGPALPCPLLVFIHVSLERDGHMYSGGLNTTCVEIDTPATLSRTQVDPLAWSFEVDTWYAVHGFVPAALAGGMRRSPDDAIVFHVYLATVVGAAPTEELIVGPM